jgi:GNAT superfamily N-acetyltransferase
MWHIQPVSHLPIDRLSSLLAASQREGFRNIDRLIQEWQAGTNRFEGTGEALFVAEQNHVWIGVCGLTDDPYGPLAGIGRIRRLYVLPTYRRSGIGRALVGAVINQARANFQQLQVRTESLVGDRFYRALGFMACPDEQHFTHTLNLD